MGLNSTSKHFLRKFKSLSLHRRKESPSPHTPLCDLPLELVELVASSLQPSDLGALRMTCKAIYGKASSVFWRVSLQSIKTDLSSANLRELEAISRDAQLRCYVNHMVFTGFDECLENLGEGYKWGLHRHQSGHLVNLQEHPAVKQLCSILCQLVNCRSFEIYAVITKVRDQSDNDNFRPTDSITTFLDIVARTHHPVTALIVNFMDEFNYAPDPQRLQVSDKDQFIAVGQHLEELKLIYTLEHGIVRDWTFNILLHAPNLHMLHLKNHGLSGYTELIHRLASVDGPWSQLQELELESIPVSIEDLMVLLQRCRHSLRVLKINTMRMYANVQDIKRMFQTLSSFPALESVSFDNFTLGVVRRDYFIHFPVVTENPFVDESQGTKFEFASNNTRGWPRVFRVAYSGPKMDVALDILARTVDDAPASIS
ncbi:hypothetical protein SI65_09379 [Aspergillus cristatus]|uniref:Uncharacterized protein n=1 Tax=Aspergillus cristatus TaxID=573508 RepID=A0A1E3B2G1_ASPCR|nr:hypothetical protein SI65_09379 [Aspergillus cristatus]